MSQDRFQKVFVGQAVQKMDSSPDWGSYSKVVLRTSDGEGYVAGDDSGITLEADCPWATQAMADALLASLQGKSYKPFNGHSAYITPAAELGDGMTSDGFYSGIYSMSRAFSKIAAADIAAPSDTEVQHEFQYIDANDRRFVRKMQEIRSELAIKVDEISAYVDGQGKKFEWSLQQDCMLWKANGSEVMKINADGLEVKGTIRGGSIITGTLEVGGANIDSSVLRTGAQWPSTSYSGGYTNGGWSLTGGGYGFNYNSASTYLTSSYPSYFRCGMLQLTDNVIVSGTVRVVVNGTAYRLVGFETT